MARSNSSISTPAPTFSGPVANGSPIPGDTDNPNVLNPATGLLSKTADTALDTYGIHGKYNPQRSVGSTYPTGQVDPAKVKSARRAFGRW